MFLLKLLLNEMNFKFDITETWNSEKIMSNLKFISFSNSFQSLLTEMKYLYEIH